MAAELKKTVEDLANANDKIMENEIFIAIGHKFYIETDDKEMCLISTANNKNKLSCPACKMEDISINKI